MALVLPVLLGLLSGIIDWSWYMYTLLNVGVVANQSVRVAAGDEDPVGAAMASACAGLPAYGLSCATGVSAVVVSRGSGPVLEVSIRLPFSPPVGLLPTPSRVEASATTSWYAEPAED